MRIWYSQLNKDQKNSRLPPGWCERYLSIYRDTVKITLDLVCRFVINNYVTLCVAGENLVSKQKEQVQEDDEGSAAGWRRRWPARQFACRRHGAARRPIASAWTARWTYARRCVYIFDDVVFITNFDEKQTFARKFFIPNQTRVFDFFVLFPLCFIKVMHIIETVLLHQCLDNGRSCKTQNRFVIQNIHMNSSGLQ